MIITLTTIPPRFDKIAPTLKSLLKQRHKADQVILYIPPSYKRFPEWTGNLPQVPEGVTISRTDFDYGPATKILPALRENWGKERDILLCDDDVYYDTHWAERYVNLRKTHIHTCLAEGGYDLKGIDQSSRPKDRLPRVSNQNRDILFRIGSMLKYRQRRASYYTQSGYSDIFLGVSGAMVRPTYFKEMVFDIPGSLWVVDDYWISGNLAVNNIPIWLNADAPRRHDSASRRISSLLNMVHEGHGRHDTNQAAINYFRETYGVWR
ncbi:glycosyltransferase family 2 protein [Brucellaceae bacterium C25G]